MYYFNSDYDDNKHECFSIGTEEENKYYTLISPNATNDNKLYYYISNENNNVMYE